MDVRIVTVTIMVICLHYCSAARRRSYREIPQFAASPLKISAFNIQVFGLKKMSDPMVVDALIKIISKYDIVAVQEIRDSSEKAFPQLVDKINQANQGTGKIYSSVVSERLGRSTSKEQYGFIYRSDIVSVEATYQHRDTKDIFQREPFAVKFYAPGKEVERFGFMVIHTEPDQAVKEIDALADVYDELVQTWLTQEILVGGDFNGDCNYVKGDDWLSVRLFTDKRFKWLISNCVDSTTKDTDCTYDRFVTAGPKLKNAVVRNSAKAFRYDLEYGLTHEQTIKVSDHYPIEIQFEGKPNRSVQRKIRPSVSFIISEDKFASTSAISAIRPGFFKVDQLYKADGTLSHVIVSKPLVRNVRLTLERFRSESPGVLSDSIASGVLAFEDTLIHPTYVYGVKDDYYSTLNIKIICEIGGKRTCDVNVYRRARL